MRIDRYIRRLYPAIPQSMLEKMLRQGKIKLDEAKVKSSVRVENGQILTTPDNLSDILPQEREKRIKEDYILTKEDELMLEESIIWEDDDLLVLNKPHDLAVQGGTGTHRHLDGILQAYGQKTRTRYRLTHRLDRDTSGVIIIAKNSQAATHVTNLFRFSEVKKIYWGITMGHMDPSYGTINMPLIKSQDGDREKIAIDPKGNRPAITAYRTLKRMEGRGKVSLSWLELSPETGRTHQLRVHCLYMNCPIVGDGKYGGRDACEVSDKLHLHARSIQITDLTGAKMVFTAPPPPHMEETLRRYGIHDSEY